MNSEGEKQRSEIRPHIEPGYTVGSLTVLEKTSERKNGYNIWKCRCDCGGEIFLDTRCLQRRTVRDCGCNTKVKPGLLDISGMRFGRLEALEITEERKESGTAVWLCRCDCGNLCKVSLHQLRCGYTKSCGCLSHPQLKDYVGKKFSHLTVIEYAGKKNGQHRWKCRCDCGKEMVVGQTRLQSGMTKSCGCVHNGAHSERAEVLKKKLRVDGTCISALEARMKGKLIASNRSGVNGVYLNTGGNWSAQITFKNKTYFLGSYNSIEEAASARKKGEEMYEDFLSWYYTQYPKKEG